MCRARRALATGRQRHADLRRAPSSQPRHRGSPPVFPPNGSPITSRRTRSMRSRWILSELEERSRSEEAHLRRAASHAG